MFSRQRETSQAMEFRERYEEDLALVRGVSGWFLLIGFLLALVLAPWYLPRYILFILTQVASASVIAIGLNLLVGYTGQISLGHAGFVGIGAYAAGLLIVKAGMPWALALLGAGCVAAVFGFLVGIPALRLSGPYLTIATLGFGIAVTQLLANWDTLSGGRSGLFLPKLTLEGRSLGEIDLYYVSVAVAVILTWMALNLVRSHVGRAFVAIRDSDIAAEMVGVNLTIYKTLAFGVSAFYAGIGGALIGFIFGSLEPQAFTVFESVTYISMIVIGGLGSIPGSVIGATLLTLLPQLLTGLKRWLLIGYGVAIIVIMTSQPLGLYGWWIKIKRWFKTWPF